jgi:hypothetical protein
MQFVGSRILLGLPESVTKRINITENYKTVNPWAHATQALYIESTNCRREHVKKNCKIYLPFINRTFRRRNLLLTNLMNVLPGNSSVNTPPTSPEDGNRSSFRNVVFFIF